MCMCAIQYMHSQYIGRVVVSSERPAGMYVEGVAVSSEGVAARYALACLVRTLIWAFVCIMK